MRALVLIAFVLSGCATTTPIDLASSRTCTQADLDTLLVSERERTMPLPGAIWRLAVHGNYDYSATLPTSFDIDARGYVANETFERALGAPQSHNRHLRQAARRALADRRYALPTDAQGGLRGCQEDLLFEFNSRWDDDF